jgi:hypothetical protein
MQDDGLPMVSCGMCSRWQHITCHDTADRNAGLPRRNWDTQQFYCQRCKPVAIQRLTNGTSRSSVTRQSGTTQPRVQKTHPSAPQYNYPQPTSDLRYSQQTTYGNGMSYTQPYCQDPHQLSSEPMYGAPQQPSSTLTFSHYQPQQHGFSRTAWSNGYPTNDMNARSMSHYSQNQQQYQNGSYASPHSSYQVWSPA